MRIISICPSNTEILFFLGLMDQVVAIDDYSDWPVPETGKLPKLGPDLNIDMDKLESFRPDLVIASLSVPGMEKNVQRLAERGIPHIVLNPKTIEDIYANIRLVAAHTSSEAKAEELIASLRLRVDRVKEKAGKRSYTPRLYWEWWPRPYISPARDTWLTQISELAGGVNIFADHPGDRFLTQTGEEIVERRPDFIMAVWPGVKPDKIDRGKILSRAGWEQVPAIRNNRIHVLEERLYCRPSPLLIEGLEELAGILHALF
ncbi:ABC transporter substrate-binding protein [Effusibacillus lacus]|uniref:Cobalamin-binding protein n=1 Tax=Effusibacillus lacus TaxID=1348429 RepID=A0A292YS24_9BACL|nr:cobalamin-binding protein [Effusibacillus lacus]TCS74899.1 iron complex transport system substrate-binding protein [Effusibacillus lacus]GAX91573.1 cobalamin-binding protein [Effusibacillus lacus]